MIHLITAKSYGPRREEIFLPGVANNKGAEPNVHPHRLFSAFVIRFSQSIRSKLATSEIHFPIGSVQTDLNLTFVGNAEGRFCYIEAHTRKIYTDPHFQRKMFHEGNFNKCTRSCRNYCTVQGL